MKYRDEDTGETKEFKLDPEVKRKWVEALRSGEYAQGTGRLAAKTLNGIVYCCLGVKAKIEGNLVPYDYDNSLFMYCGTGATGSLPLEEMPPEIQEKLSTFNDTDERSFKWIASYIERYL